MRGTLAKQIRSWALEANIGKPWKLYQMDGRRGHDGVIRLHDQCTRCVYQDMKDKVKRTTA